MLYRTIILSFFLGFSNNVSAQIKTPEELRNDADARLAQLVADRDFSFGQFAVLFRGRYDDVWEKGVYGGDVVVLRSEDTEDNVKHNFANIGFEKLPPNYWEQVIYEESQTFLRKGFGFRHDSFQHFKHSDGVTPNQIRKSRRFPSFDPYCGVLTTCNNLFYSIVDDGYAAEMFLLNGELLGAELSPEGELRAAWFIQGRLAACVEFTFSKEYPNRPSRVLWRRCQHKITFDERRKIQPFAHVEVEWQTGVVSTKDGKIERVILPVSMDSTMYGSEGVVDSVLSGTMRWYLGSDDVDFPRVPKKHIGKDKLSSDWREPFRKLFDENWDRPYEESQKLHDEIEPRIFGPAVVLDSSSS